MRFRPAGVIGLARFLDRFSRPLHGTEVDRRLARGAFWSVVGTVLSRGTGLVATIVVARILGRTVFGELGIVQSTVGMFQALAGFGLGLTATKYVAEYAATDPRRTERLLGLSRLMATITGLIATGILAVLAGPLAERVLHAPHLAELLRWSSVMLLLGALNAEQLGALAGFEAFRTLAVVNLLAGVATFPLAIGGAALWGLRGALMGMIASMAVNWFLNHWALRRQMRKAGIRANLRGCGREWRVLLGFSLPTVLAGLMFGAVTWACQAILVRQNGGFASLGIYNVIMQIKAIPTLILTALLYPLLPVLSERFARGDKKGYGLALWKAYSVSLLVMAPFALLLVTEPQWVFLPFGKDFGGHRGAVQWLMLHAIIVGLSMPLRDTLASSNRMWFGFAYNLGWGAVFLSGTWLLAPTWGADGVAAALALAQFIAAVPFVFILYTRLREFKGRFPLVSCALMLLGLFAIMAAVSHLNPTARRMVALPLIGGALGAGVWLIARGRRQDGSPDAMKIGPARERNGT
jgi:O-antigen/teichoic acid export membrane protein